MRPPARSTPLRVGFVVFALVVGTGLVGCSRDPDPEQAAQAFLAGWASGNLEGVAFEGEEGTTLAPADVLAQIDALSGDLDPRRVRGQAAGDPQVEDGYASIDMNIEWTIVDGLVWPYPTTVRLHEVDGAWRVVFTPATVHPKLATGDQFTVAPAAAARGSIVDGTGEPIFSERPVVVVGVEPQRVTDVDSLVAELDAALAAVGVTGVVSDLPQRIAAANPDAFVEVVTLRREAYDQIRDRIHPLDGTVFREATLPLAPTRDFARALLGTVGEATREQLDASPGRYLVGQLIGQSGLQAQFDGLLRGVPGVEITYRQEGPLVGDVLFSAEPQPGGVLATTLDQRVQLAADAALEAEPRRAAVVAVRVSDGAIVAVANGPDGGELNLALAASVPPGSTFKMVSALALLASGQITADTSVDCPQSFPVDGRSFTNAGNFQLGTVPFHVAFARSCNTAFASLAPKLGADGLRSAARTVGIGTTWNLGTEVFSGSVGANESNVERAAAAFGQGTTLVSPASLAAAAAAVARGSWIAPKLLGELPAGAAPAVPGPAGDPPADGTALPADAVAALQQMMREVVTAGTATALGDGPGLPVHVKTGTAEFNSSDSHAWTIGWQGDIAFAVFVENGGDSGDAAVPIVESFLRGLN